MTEASHQMTSNPLPKHGPHKPGSVGQAQGSMQVTLDPSPDSRVQSQDYILIWLYKRQSC